MASKELEKLHALEREMEVIGKVHDLLKLGTFQGQYAQDLAISQMYMQGLHQRIKAEVDRISPLEMPAKQEASKVEAVASSEAIQSGEAK